MSLPGRERTDHLAGEALDALIAEMIWEDAVPAEAGVEAGACSPAEGWIWSGNEWKPRPFSRDESLALRSAERWMRRTGWQCHLYHPPMSPSDVWACTLTHEENPGSRRLSYLPPLLSEPVGPALAICRALIKAALRQ